MSGWLCRSQGRNRRYGKRLRSPSLLPVFVRDPEAIGPEMSLVYDWKRVLRYGWSIRLIVLAGLLSGAEVVLPLFDDAIPRNLFAVLSLLVTVGAVVARVVAQPKMYDK